MKLSINHTGTSFIAAAILLAIAVPAVHAQAIYRIIGPDGRITFSDQRPTADQKVIELTPSGRVASSSAQDGLPLALRQVASRYPVTLYSGDGCEPCNAGRSMLMARGIPFAERTVTTPQDSEALQQLSGQNLLPLLTIGTQQLKGFSSSEWGQYLDAAGYPPASLLPSGYRNPPPAALAPSSGSGPASAQSGQDTTPAVTPPPPPPAAPENPSGIRF
jgi:glutaredoxin